MADVGIDKGNNNTINNVNAGSTGFGEFRTLDYASNTDALTRWMKDIGFLAFFVGGLALCAALFGEKITFYYLLLVLSSMVVVNSNKINQLFKEVTP